MKHFLLIITVFLFLSCGTRKKLINKNQVTAELSEKTIIGENAEITTGTTVVEITDSTGFMRRIYTNPAGEFSETGFSGKADAVREESLQRKSSKTLKSEIKEEKSSASNIAVTKKKESSENAKTKKESKSSMAFSSIFFVLLFVSVLVAISYILYWIKKNKNIVKTLLNTF
jgi:cobalamin biosynthesis Mg chelatase CobN